VNLAGTRELTRSRLTGPLLVLAIYGIVVIAFLHLLSTGVAGRVERFRVKADRKS
jgi:hypothetical protein